MIKGGYILQPRIIDNSETMSMPPVSREVWSYLLRKVNHKDTKNIKRGQGLFTYNEILNDLCWYVGYRKEMYSKPQLSKALRKLCEASMIETAKTTRGVIITVCNYGYYQDPKNYEGNTKETRRKEEGSTINNNDNKENKEISYNKRLLSELNNSDFELEQQQYYEIAISYYELFKSNLESLNISTTTLKKAKGGWVDDIRLMFEVDEYKLEDFQDVWQFLKKDEFWKKNILSTKKLRDKFNTLLINARQNGANKINNKKGCTIDQVAEAIGKNFATD